MNPSIIYICWLKIKVIILLSKHGVSLGFKSRKNSRRNGRTFDDYREFNDQLYGEIKNSTRIVEVVKLCQIFFPRYKEFNDQLYDRNKNSGRIVAAVRKKP